MFEKDIVFGFAQSFAERLEASGRYRLLMTRDRDVFVPLAERVRVLETALHRHGAARGRGHRTRYGSSCVC